MIELLLLKIPILGSKIIDFDSFFEMLIRFSINLIVAFIVIRKIYYPIHKRKDYLFTYFLFNILIFFVCILLNGVKLKLGFAFGLFAIFGILRYRTEQLPIKEMTYLFMIIAIAIVNSLSDQKVSLAELLLVNGTIVLATYLLEKVFLLKHESRKEIVYEKIENVKPENHKLLIADLKDRTGLNIHQVQIGRIDFLKDTVRIIVFYYEDENSNVSIENTFISNKNE
ncbi:DUF4956 domain-containing protein [Brumimicrobium glaciale]|jgi:hypothetical protein|uniref:DUF4956 domain-containing protein n=1 Tax=Brumimicrobium glaciale TaxID=200475 RepID=A0A4Q4KFE8_9FLAO|nr:DUF4956 domain-containing protein [Brumimicrobium glaciale]RYM31438.1 DUF4956 domain-containing protein [Brumimicrobium glaciale]